MSQAPSPPQLPVNDRIHLSPVQVGDKAALVRWLNEREIYDRTLLIPYPYTEADADAFLNRLHETRFDAEHAVQFGIRQANGELIGGCGFAAIVPGHRAELGYWLARPFWGQGIMTEVTRTLCDWAVAEWHLVRITAHVVPENEASARVLEKCGFRCEGLLRKHHRKEGRFLDTRLFALVK